MARDYDVKGTREYIIWSIVALLVCLWAIRDGWFPGEKAIAKHGVPADGDHFYTFNRTLAYLAGIGSVVCAYIHKFVK